jgi:hypothetical protein
MHNFLRGYDIGNGAPIQTIKVCATSLPKAKNHSSASFFLSLVRLAEFRGRWSVYLNSESASKRNFSSHFHPILPPFRSYWALLPSLLIRPFFLKKKDQKFKPASRRMLKHRKNVALHAQFFARLRYRERRADTSCRDCATSLPKAKNHSSASFFLSLVRLAEFRARWSAYFNSGRASKRSRLKKISENLRHLRETKISSRTFIRSFQLSNRIGRNYHRFLFVLFS